MFKSIIQTTPFSSQNVNCFFPNIPNGYQGTYLNDSSFISTIRALLAPRMKEEDVLSLRFTSTSYRSGQARSENLNAVCNFEPNTATNQLIIHSFAAMDDSNNETWMKVVEENFCETYDGYHRLERVTELYRPICNVLCYVCPERKVTALFVQNMDVRKMHALQAAIPGYIPWYFEGKAITAEEKELLDSLFKYKMSDKYIECLARMAEKYDFEANRVRRLLEGFETQFERNRIERLRNNISSEDQQIRDYSRAIGEAIARRRDYETELFGLEMRIGKCDDSSEIMEYFLNNKSLVLQDVFNSSRMIFCVKDYLSYFDEDLAKRVIDNKDGYIYRPNDRSYDSVIPTEDMKKLMTAIFVDQTLRMKVCAAYEFDMRGSVCAIRSYDYDNVVFSEYTPNTHIDAYRCLGSYESTINRLLVDANYIGAIEQCIASCKSLNFGDSTVMAEFMLRLYGHGHSDRQVNIRCIELPSGQVVTPKEAIAYLKEQEERVNG